MQHARGGNRSQGYKYSGSNNPDEVSWCGEKFDVGHSRPVGMKKANELGIHDMSGNVLEWCQGWYGEYSTLLQQNHEGAVKGSYCVFRGGFWYGGDDGNTLGCRVSYREYQISGFSSCGLGFRVVCSATDL
jgi:formylglycine-generating enzyme required for sulfatase activity